MDLVLSNILILIHYNMTPAMLKTSCDHFVPSPLKAVEVPLSPDSSVPWGSNIVALVVKKKQESAWNITHNTHTLTQTHICSPDWQLFVPSQLHKEGGSQWGREEWGSPWSHYK